MEILRGHCFGERRSEANIACHFPFDNPSHAAVQRLNDVDNACGAGPLAGCVGGWWWRHRPAGTRLLAAGLMLSTAYLGWSWTAKAMIERQVAASLVGTGLEAAPRFSVPQPFQTVLWRAVVMTPEGYLEAERSLWADRGPLRWRHHKADDALLEQLADVPAVQRLTWFNRGFMRMAEQDGRAIATDLRMGAEPNYVFKFIVAEHKASGDGLSIRPRQQRPRFGDRDLSRLWQRIWPTRAELGPKRPDDPRPEAQRRAAGRRCPAATAMPRRRSSGTPPADA